MSHSTAQEISKERYALFQQLLLQSEATYQSSPDDDRHSRKLFDFIVSTPNGEQFMTSAIEAASKLPLARLDSQQQPHPGNPGFAKETPATLTVTGFFLYLTFDFDASEIKKAGNAKCGGYYGICTPTPVTGVLYYDSTDDLQGSMTVQVNATTSSGVMAMNVNFVSFSPPKILATFVGTGEGILSGYGGGQLTWEDSEV